MSVDVSHGSEFKPHLDDVDRAARRRILSLINIIINQFISVYRLLCNQANAVMGSFYF